MVPIYHDQLRAVKEYEYHKVNGLLPKEFIVPEDLLLVGCHNYPYDSFFEEQMKYHKCKNYRCLKLKDIKPWSNTKRLIPYINFLESKYAKNKKYVIFVDTDDVFFYKSPHEVLEIFLNKFDCDLLFNATSFWKGYWYTEESLENQKCAKETHNNLFLNAGAYIGKKDFVIEVFKKVLDYVTHEDLKAKEWYEKEKAIANAVNTLKFHEKEGKSAPKHINKLAKLSREFPKGCGSDQAILRHIERSFYPRLQIDTDKKIFSRIGHTLKWRQQNRRRNVFIDCGGHKGQSIEKFKRSKQYRDSKFEIFSFEPNFDLIQNYAKNNPEVHIHSKAVWVKDEKINFYLDRNDGDGSSVLTEKIHPNGYKENDLDNPLEVDAINFSQWIFKNFEKKDYIVLKMDIEGAEYHVLPKMIKDGTIKYINEIYIEWHHKKVNVDEKVHQKLVKQLDKICEKVHGEWIKGSEHLKYV